MLNPHAHFGIIFWRGADDQIMERVSENANGGYTVNFVMESDTRGNH